MLLNETGSEPQDKVSTGLYRGVSCGFEQSTHDFICCVGILAHSSLLQFIKISGHFMYNYIKVLPPCFIMLVLRCGISHGKPCLTLALIYRGIHDWVNDCKVTRSCDWKTRPNHPPLCLQLVWGLCSAMLCLDFHQIWWRALWPNIYTFMLSLQRTLFQKISLDGTF